MSMEQAHCSCHPLGHWCRRPGPHRHEETLRGEVRQLPRNQWWQYSRSLMHHQYPVGEQQNSMQKPVELEPSTPGSIETPPPNLLKIGRSTWNAPMDKAKSWKLRQPDIYRCSSPRHLRRSRSGSLAQRTQVKMKYSFSYKRESLTSSKRNVKNVPF